MFSSAGVTKKKARAEKAALERAQKSTGNCVQLPVLSVNAELVLSAIGSEMAVGIGPAESPIGVSKILCIKYLGHQAFATPRASGHRPTQRARRVLPPECFICAQQELNDLVKVR